MLEGNLFFKISRHSFRRFECTFRSAPATSRRPSRSPLWEGFQQSAPLLSEVTRSQRDACQLLFQRWEQEEVGRGEIRRVGGVFDDLDAPFREIVLHSLRGMDTSIIPVQSCCVCVSCLDSLCVAGPMTYRSATCSGRTDQTGSEEGGER